MVIEMDKKYLKRLDGLGGGEETVEIDLLLCDLCEWVDRSKLATVGEYRENPLGTTAVRSVFTD